MTPIQALFQSRKFLILLMDTGVSFVLFFVGKYAGAVMEDVKFIILAIQPVALMLIYAIAKEDAAEKSAPQFINTFDEIDYDEEDVEE